VHGQYPGHQQAGPERHRGIPVCVDGPASYVTTFPKVFGETFLSLRVRTVPAVISRGACCNGGGWSAVWYDPAADVTYSLHLPLSSAYPYMQPSPERGYLSSPDHILGAREVAGMAEQLVVLR